MTASETKTPKRRFAGFTDDWEQWKLGKVGSTFTGLSGKTKEDFGHGDAKFVTYVNVFGNVISNPEMLESVEIDSKQNSVQYGDVFFTTSSETPEEVGISSVWLENQENVYLNSFCFGYRPTEKFDVYYLASVLRSDSVRKKIVFLAQGISRYNISKTKVMEMTIPVPDLAEQERVGQFFTTLDATITLHQRKLEKVKALKVAYLAEMFPAEGECKPKRRFAGFTDAWEQCRFYDNIEDIIDFRGRTPKKLGMDWSESGYLALSALNVKQGYIDFNADVHYGNQELYDKWMAGKKLTEGKVLFTTEAPMGNVAQVPDNKGYILSQRTISFDIKPEKITDDFLAILLTSPLVFNELTALSSGGTAKGISQKSMSHLSVKTPKDLKEQEKVASFFQILDRTITFHQRKLEKLQNLKKAYLDEMFA